MSRPVAHLSRTNCARRAEHYPAFFKEEQQQAGGSANAADQPMIRFADVGCGFGGLLVR